MADNIEPLSHLLPHAAPDITGTRLFLQAVRRMGVGGLNDAHAANMMIGAFGMSFRRPLVLVRALMAELARASTCSIMIAPSCCCRMTLGESMLVQAVSIAQDDPHEAHGVLRRLCMIDQGIGILSSAQAVALAFGDLGRPIEFP
jgi:hypothetical protein